MYKIQYLKNIWKHFKKICIHKYWVAKYCFKVGLYWQGITHDLSKFSPVEFIEGIKYYQGNRSPIKACKEKNGYSLAWLHHKAVNKHHYQYWTDDFAKYHSEGLTLIEMPYKYTLELICDYLGAVQAYYGNSFSYKKEYEWWIKQKDNIAMNENTKLFVDKVLFRLANTENDEFLSDKVLLQRVYEENRK